MIGLLLDTFRTLLGERKFRRQLIERHPGLSLGANTEIRSPDRLTLGRNVVIDRNVLLHCGGMAWCSNGGGIQLGDEVFIGPNCVLFGAGGISIGAKSMLSPGVVVASHGHRFDDLSKPMRDQPSDFKPVVIAENVWVGSNATLLPGITIGAGSIIGAGAVVARDIPARWLALGVPARPVREI